MSLRIRTIVAWAVASVIGVGGVWVDGFVVVRPFAGQPTRRATTWGWTVQGQGDQQQRSCLSAAAGSNANEIMPLARGCVVALVTPFTASGKVDVPTLRALLQMHVAAGTDGLCILGTTGEASVLTDEERTLVLQTAVEEVKGKMPIIAGTGTINPAVVKDNTQRALDLGCDAGLVVTPYYVKPPPRALLQFYNNVANVGLPVVMYNVPGRTSVDMKPDLVAACAQQHENIVAIKDATADVERVSQIRQAMANNNNVDKAPPLLLYSGDDLTQVDFCLRGGDGCVSVTANVAPRLMHQMMEAALAGEEAEARRMDDLLRGLHTHLFCESNPIPVKYAVHRLGLCETHHCRPPLVDLDPQLQPLVDEALQAAQLLE